MKQYRNLFGSLMFLALLPVFAQDILATSLTELPQTLWRERFEDENLEYEYKAAALSRKDGSIWLVVGLRPKGKLGGPQRLSLWKLDTSGRKVSEVEIEAFSKDQGAKEKYRRIQALAVVENGDILLVAESESGQVSLIRLEGKNSQPLFIKEIGGAHRPLLITKIIMTTDGKFLLIGRAFSKAFLMKIESSGNVVWEKTVRGEKLSLFLDGLVTDEGDIVLTGSHLARGGETNIWVGKFTPYGDLIDRNNFGGRYSSVAKEKGSGYVLVYDKRGPRGWDIWMRGLRSDLTESRNKKILSEVKVSLPFRIADVPSGDFIVVGSKQSRLWVSRIKEGAKVKWTYMHREEGISWERLWNVDLLSSHDEFFVPFTMIVVNSRAEQRQVIRLIKFLAK